MSQITFRLRSTTVFRLRVDLRTGGGCRNSTLARAAVVAVFCRYPLTKTDSDRRTDSEIDATSAVGMAQICPNLGGQPASSGGVFMAVKSSSRSAASASICKVDTRIGWQSVRQRVLRMPETTGATRHLAVRGAEKEVGTSVDEMANAKGLLRHGRTRSDNELRKDLLLIRREVRRRCRQPLSKGPHQ